MCVQIIIQRIPNRGKNYNFNVHSKCTYTFPSNRDDSILMSVNRKMNYHEIGIINQRERVPKREAKIERRRIIANPILSQICFS